MTGIWRYQTARGHAALPAFVLASVAASVCGCEGHTAKPFEVEDASTLIPEVDSGVDAAEDAALAEGCPELELVELAANESWIKQDAVWPAARYRLSAPLNVEGARLTIAPCSVIELPARAAVDIMKGGALNAVGEAEKPIRFTSASPTPSDGAWAGVLVRADAASGQSLDYVTVEYGGAAKSGGITLQGGANASIQNTTVTHALGVGVLVTPRSTLSKFDGNDLHDNAEGPLSIGVNAVGSLGRGSYAPNGVDAILLTSETVDHDATWAELGVPYHSAEGFIALAADGESAVVTLAAGTTLALGKDAIVSIRANAGLTFAGEADRPVTITSSRASAAPGDWNHIAFARGSFAEHNTWQHAVLEYGGGVNAPAMVSVDTGASLSVHHSVLRNANGFGIDVRPGARLDAFEDNTVSGCAAGPVRIGADAVDTLGVGTYGPNPVAAITVTDERVEHDATWRALGVPYALGQVTLGGTSVASAHLTVEAGTTLAVNGGLIVSQNGGLTLAGSAAQHVVLTCGKPSCAPGDWRGISVDRTSVAAYNTFSYTDIAYAGTSIAGQVRVDAAATLALSHCTFTNALACDITLAASSSTLSAGESTYTLCP